jgi:hypothetical protein
LEYCGFTDQARRTDIAADGFESYDDVNTLTEKDIGSLAKGFAERTTVNGKIIFGLRRTNLLKATIHWAQDFRRISRVPTLDDIADQAEFREALETARLRAQIRRHNAEESDGLSKAADPGKLKRQKEWTTWSRALKNYLSTILGQNGVPLSYVIREEEAPNYELEDEPDYDFEQLSIDCAPMDGLIYKTDSRKVHQLIHGFVQGEVAETWIKPKEKKQDGRLDYKALEAHYGGEGNKAVRIQEAEVLRTTLHYKSERTMSFDKFLTNMQSMFTGFADNEEILTEAQKIRLLFAKVQSPNLALVKSNLQIAYDLDQTGEVTFDFIANSLAVEASKSPDSAASRNASGVDTRGSGADSAPVSGVKGPDGVIFTGYYSNFAQLSDADKQTIFDERKRLGVTNATGKRSGKKRYAKASSIKAKKKTVAKMTREIASLKIKFKALEAKRDAASSGDDTETAQDDAGNQFSGRKKKKKKE